MKIITYFLPQFYSTPENDSYWGKGFTDWVNTKNAKKYFNTHKVPFVPSKFGYYDLSQKETIKTLSDYSIENGIDGFGYWHYWFGNGIQTLEKVPEIHLENLDIKQNFFFAWSNTSWTKSWVGDDDTIIFKQEYNEKSAIEHFNYLKKFFDDDRYIKKDGKPLFQVINSHLKGAQQHIRILEKLSLETYGHGIYWIFPEIRDSSELDSLNFTLSGFPPGEYAINSIFFKIKRKLQKVGLFRKPIVVTEDDYLKKFENTLKRIKKEKIPYIPCLLSGWDNTARYKEKGFLIDTIISSFINSQINVLQSVYSNDDLNFIFIKAWNEWAEGNILEPYEIMDEEDNPLQVVSEFKKSFS